MRRTSRIALIKIKVPMLVSGAEPAAVVGKCRAAFRALARLPRMARLICAIARHHSLTAIPVTTQAGCALQPVAGRRAVCFSYWFGCERRSPAMRRELIPSPG